MGSEKSCRHVGQAVRLPDFRRELKKKAQFLCELCQHNPNTNLKSLELLLQSWETYEQKTDLIICITCSFVGCIHQGHFQTHYETHSRHFVGFQVVAKTFWCEACNMEIPIAIRPKLEAARQEYCEAIREIAAKKRRQLGTQRHIAMVSLSTMTRSNGSEKLRLEDESDADTAVVLQENASGESKKDGDQGNELALLNMPLRKKAGENKIRRRMLKTAMNKRDVLLDMNMPTSNCDFMNEVELPNTVLGFTNVGNTCYFNAAIQALLTATYYCPEHTHIEEVLETTNTPITTTFTMLHETVKKRARKALAEDVDLDRRLKSKSGRSRSSSSSVLTVAPLLKEMRNKFAQFRGNYQQDAHELFASFLWAIDEEMDPPLPSGDEPSKTSAKSAPANIAITSSCSTANSSELSNEDGDTFARQKGTWSEEDATDNEQTENSGQEFEDDGGESEADNPEQEDTKQIFVKTETGETISMQVPKSATVKDVQHLLAKQLNLKEDDMILTASKVDMRTTLSARPSVVLCARAEKRKMYSRLNLTRNLFGGALTTTVACKACGQRTKIVEDAFHLSVSVPDGHQHELTITDCLDNFVAETRLLVENNNGYDCEKCSRQPKVRSAAGRFIRKKRLGSNAQPEMEVVLRDASMQLYVSAIPRILVVHIKRLARSRKITQHIVFNEKLDMTPYVSKELRQGGGDARKSLLCYELIAVVVHMGNKRSGHYVAYVSRSRRREALLSARGRSRFSIEKNEATVPVIPRSSNKEGSSRTWYYVGDTVVKRVSFEQVLQCEAYMLFYQRRSKTFGSKATPATSSRAKTENSSTETAL